jgi:DNA polymerase III subunit beta
MEISIKREELVRGLHLVQGVVERRNPLPILANVLIEPAEGGIALTATDTDVGLRGRLPADVKKPGRTTLSARKLYEIAREASADDLILRSSTAGWVELVAGRSKFKVVSLDPKDFPQLPFGRGEAGDATLKMAAGTLRDMIDRTLFAVSTDETRFNLSGVYMENADDGSIRMVATDGHRLALIDRTVPGAKIPRGVIMPRKGLVEVRKLLEDMGEGEVTLTVGGKDVRLETASVSFFMRLIEGEFPDYRQVIPSSTRVKAKLNRDDLQAALRRISLLASERSHGVRFHLEKGTLEVSASNPEQGEATEDLDVSYAGDSLTIGFNARYVLDVLAVHGAGEVIELGLTDEVGPGILRGAQDPEYTYVVMPMRL